MAKIYNAMDFINSLSDKEKAGMFDEIAKNFYASNFGMFSKSQLDLLMFSLFIDKLIDKEMDFDDYTMSKLLGILQSSVRSLKKKKQLIYPRDYKWYDSFLKDNQHTTFDGEKIVICISDPNVYIELQHAIEELGGYTEVQLNPKLLKIPPGYFIELLLRIHAEDKKLSEDDIRELRKALIKQLNERFHEDQNLEGLLTEDDFKSKLKKAGLETTFEILGNVIPGGIIAEYALSFAKKLF